MYRLSTFELVGLLLAMAVTGMLIGAVVESCEIASSCVKSGAFQFEGKTYFCGIMERGRYVW